MAAGGVFPQMTEVKEPRNRLLHRFQQVSTAGGVFGPGEGRDLTIFAELFKVGTQRFRVKSFPVPFPVVCPLDPCPVPIPSPQVSTQKDNCAHSQDYFDG